MAPAKLTMLCQGKPGPEEQLQKEGERATVSWKLFPLYSGHPETAVGRRALSHNKRASRIHPLCTRTP